ncbi:MAG TPA: tRNA adenosine(34) deaminase TadA [Woeseiaceae bacterium]|nr:tRNA adenosine(34) deaminase TadA [Woeseiaceae bacterium]
MTDRHWPQDDIDCMSAALAEAKVAMDNGEVPVGAVLVENGTIVSRAHNCSIMNKDPSGHAEIAALRTAAQSRDNHRLPGSTLYVTLEPCIMCAGALSQARVGRVVFGAYDKKAGALGSVEDLSTSRALNHHYEVNGGLRADESMALLRAFFQSRR